MTARRQTAFSSASGNPSAATSAAARGGGGDGRGGGGARSGNSATKNVIKIGKISNGRGREITGAPPNGGAGGGGKPGAGGWSSSSASRTHAEVQTFTMDHFVQGIVTWDIFGEIHAEAKGNR